MGQNARTAKSTAHPGSGGALPHGPPNPTQAIKATTMNGAPPKMAEPPQRNPSLPFRPAC